MKKKIGLIIIIIILFLIAFSDKKSTEKAINQCVNAGHSYEYCAGGLY